MLITFLLLAVLAIGAVSASDDVASDNLTVSDDADVIEDSNYDSYEHYIDVNDEEIDIDDVEYNDWIASITLPKNTKGSFQIHNNEEIVASLEVNKNDDDHWELDSGILEGTIYLNDFNITKVHNGDNLTFKFFELIGGNYIEVESFTIVCKVSLTDTTMGLSEITDGMAEEDVDFQIYDIDYNKPYENFTYVNVALKEGIFIISIDGEEDIIKIFREDLNTTNRHYVKTIDEAGNPVYRFGFSFNDINNYLAQEGLYANFKEVVEKEKIDSGEDMYFELYEDEDDMPISDKTMIFTLKDKGISFKAENEEDEDVEVEYGDLDIIMKEGWNETELIEFIVRKDITGKIVIYLNNNKTPSFEKSLSDLTPDDSEDDDEFNHYFIHIGDLNITQAGEYIIRDYFDDKNGNHIYQYDEEDPEILVLYEPQSMTVDNVTVEVNPIPTTIDGNETLITIDATASEEDEVLVYVDGNEDPIKIKIGDCEKDENGNYTINAEKLGLEAGEHDLNITYKGKNLTAKVNLASKLVIELPEEGELIYTTFKDSFVFLSLEEDNIFESKINGTINLTIIDNAGNIIDTLEQDIRVLSYNNDAIIITTNDLKIELNGKYRVIVRYFDGNEAATEIKGNVTFKSFDSTDYGTSIKDIVKDENDYAITFTAIPSRHDISVEIDGITTVKIDEATLKDSFDSEKGVYYIKYQQIKGFADGPHSISVYIESNLIYGDLTNGTLLVDLEKNIDPELTITVSNIEEGNAANVIIKTNASFTGEITLQVANKNYTVNVVNGQATISIPGLTANTYTATAFLKSNGIFNDSIKTATFTVISKAVTPVKKADVIKLTLKKVKVKKSAKKLVLKATLKINGKAVKGKTITFKFNGKTFKAKTNKKGVAKATIKKKVLKKLKVGKKVTYTAKYLAKTVKKTVKVKR